MKLVNIFLSAAVMSAAAMAEAPTAKEQGAAAIKQLGGALKSELQAKMKKDPSGMEAVKFCTENAGTITKDVNGKLPENVSVRRTSLKPRNSTNKPDETDVNVMDVFAKEIAAKQISPGTIKVVEANGAIRVYKPLVTQKVCLKCHGSNISPEISTVIKGKYPNDQATGFKESDLRGVIVAEVKK
jgi:hypothetical protein